MKTLFQPPLKLVALLLFVLCATATAMAQSPRIDMAHLDYLGGKASETLSVNIDEKLLQLTAKFFGNEPDDKQIKELISGLKGIYVKSFEFEHEGEYTASDLESIRSQFRNSAWTRIVGVTSKKEGDVEVYVMSDGNRIGGLAVLSVEPKELTVVNIVGPVDLARLATLEDQFGIPNLGIEPPAKAKPRK